MKISVVTVVYNGERTIRDTIESVLSQTHSDIEYIVIDGASKDGTMDIVHSYGDCIQKVVSEPDNGIYDAMNKGILNATGEVIAVINADDVYADNDVIQTVAETFANNRNVGCVYGDLHYVDQEDTSQVRRVWKSRPYHRGIFHTGWQVPHPSFFVRKSTYDTHGLYRTDMPVAADYEMILRLMEVNHVPSIYIPKVMVKMRTGGNSGRSLKNIFKGNMEILRSWKVNGLVTPYWSLLFKPFSKAVQFVRPAR